MSYRPSPVDLVSPSWRSSCREKLKRDLDVLRGTFFDITLKDVETVQNDPNRIREWVQIARRAIEECY